MKTDSQCPVKQHLWQRLMKSLYKEQQADPVLTLIQAAGGANSKISQRKSAPAFVSWGFGKQLVVTETAHSSHLVPLFLFSFMLVFPCSLLLLPLLFLCFLFSLSSCPFFWPLCNPCLMLIPACPQMPPSSRRYWNSRFGGWWVDPGAFPSSSPEEE